MTWNKSYNYYKTKKQNGYDSKFEAGFAEELEIRKKCGDIVGFKSHQTIPLIVNDYIVCDYIIDFVIEHTDGTIEYVETKGYPTPVWKLKWKLFCALFEDDPNIKISLVMQGKSWKPRMRRKR